MVNNKDLEAKKKKVETDSYTPCNLAHKLSYVRPSYLFYFVKQIRFLCFLPEIELCQGLVFCRYFQTIIECSSTRDD